MCTICHVSLASRFKRPFFIHYLIPYKDGHTQISQPIYQTTEPLGGILLNLHLCHNPRLFFRIS